VGAIMAVCACASLCRACHGDAGFGPAGIDAAVLRQELGKPVQGYIVAGRRAAA